MAPKIIQLIKENFGKHTYALKKFFIKILRIVIVQAKFYLIAACNFFLINCIK